MVSSLFGDGKRATLIWAAALIASIAVIDWRVVKEAPLGFLYLLPMLLLGKVLKPWQTALAAALCTFLTEEFDQYAWHLRAGLPRDVLYFMAFFSVGVFVSEMTRNRQIILGRNSNLQVSAKCGNQSAKPGERLWRQTLPSTGKYLQIIKLLKQNLRGPFLVLQFLPFCSSNLSLNAILVKVLK